MESINSSSRSTSRPQSLDETTAGHPVDNTLTDQEKQGLKQVITEANALKIQLRRLSLTNQSAVELGISVMRLIGEINSELQTPSVIDRNSFRTRH